mmetsp:Transcript_15659/g.27056  ORF Transcript_15659/g.27056 Transcript_15659/m.27056 type:complete len:253 (+) Transcript_15659:734-1492(+)
MGRRPHTYVHKVLRNAELARAHFVGVGRFQRRLQRVRAGDQGRQGLQQAQVGGGRAPSAACAGHRVARPRPHLHRHRRHHARGGRGGGVHRPQRHRDDHRPLRRRRRPERQQSRDGRRPHPQAHWHPHLLHTGALTDAESRAGDAAPQGAAVRHQAARAAGRRHFHAPLSGGHRCAVGEDPHVQLQGQPRHRPPPQPELQPRRFPRGRHRARPPGLHRPRPRGTPRRAGRLGFIAVTNRLQWRSLVRIPIGP